MLILDASDEIETRYVIHRAGLSLKEISERLNHELVQALRLPEYWREVGWPDMCRPIGEHDFECG